MEITTVIINFQTPDYLNTAVNSFCSEYPDIPVLIIDNGSRDNSKEMITRLQTKWPNVEAEFLDDNIYHGPAMNKAAIELVKTKYIFFLDSDTETLKGGFIEEMYSLLQENKVYAVGGLNQVNERGFQTTDGNITILQTPYMLLDRELYSGFKPFIHHGQPTMLNYRDAWEKGYELRSFPVSKYIYHKWRGTAERFGYGLGLKGKLDFVLNKLGL